MGIIRLTSQFSLEARFIYHHITSQETGLAVNGEDRGNGEAGSRQGAPGRAHGY